MYLYLYYYVLFTPLHIKIFIIPLRSSGAIITEPIHNCIIYTFRHSKRRHSAKQHGSAFRMSKGNC